MTHPQPSARPDEIARFDRLAAQWWDPAGPMRPLHAMNPLRVDWINRRLGAPKRLLDIGCGAGIAAETLARLGHQVLGIDAAGEAIAAAQAHAEGQHLPLAYRQATPEQLLTEPPRFEVITALEVIEHVANPETFLKTLANLLEPGGTLFLSTLNRTPQSLLVAKLGAEYLLRLLPIGTHDWTRFLTPAELATTATKANLRLQETAGLTYNPRTQQWQQSKNLTINYIAKLHPTATR